MYLVHESNPSLYNSSDAFRLFEEIENAYGHAVSRGFGGNPYVKSIEDLKRQIGPVGNSIQGGSIMIMNIAPRDTKPQVDAAPTSPNDTTMKTLNDPEVDVKVKMKLLPPDILARVAVLDDLVGQIVKAREAAGLLPIKGLVDTVVPF